MFTVLAFLANQQMHQPCSTSHSEMGTTVHCGFPVKTLKQGGVLVSVIGAGMPGWKIAKVVGHHLVIDHHAARESVIRNPKNKLDATTEYWITIDRGVPDNFYEIEVFVRSSGVSKDQRVVQTMLNSIRID